MLKNVWIDSEIINTKKIGKMRDSLSFGLCGVCLGLLWFFLIVFDYHLGDSQVVIFLLCSFSEFYCGSFVDVWMPRVRQE